MYCNHMLLYLVLDQGDTLATHYCGSYPILNAPDSLPKGGGGVWYSFIHSNLQSTEYQKHESDWMSVT